MKIAFSVIFAFVLGLASSYLFLSKAFSTASQMAFEINISNNIKYLELLEQDETQVLKKSLKTSIDCMGATYKNYLENLFWEKTEYSKKLLEDLKPYIIEGSSCDAIRKSGLL